MAHECKPNATGHIVAGTRPPSTKARRASGASPSSPLARPFCGNTSPRIAVGTSAPRLRGRNSAVQPEWRGWTQWSTMPGLRLSSLAKEPTIWTSSSGPLWTRSMLS